MHNAFTETYLCCNCNIYYIKGAIQIDRISATFNWRERASKRVPHLKALSSLRLTPSILLPNSASSSGVGGHATRREPCVTMATGRRRRRRASKTASEPLLKTNQRPVFSRYKKTGRKINIITHTHTWLSLSECARTYVRFGDDDDDDNNRILQPEQ